MRPTSRSLDRTVHTVLVSGLAEEVVRRLTARKNGAAPLPSKLPAHRLEDLCRTLIAEEDTGVAMDMVGAKATGSAEQAAVLDDLSAAARILGDWWLTDRATFFEVTVGTGRIIEILRAVSREATPPLAHHDLPVVFASVPGDQHTLGVRMAAELFQRDGWDISLKIGLTEEELVADIAQQPVCIVGLSLGGRHSLDALSSLVKTLHATCPGAILAVCGQNIDDLRPELAAMQLDGIASGVLESKLTISALWDRETGMAGSTRKECEISPG